MATSSDPLNALRVVTAASGIHQTGWATKQDWARHRVLIGQLYEKGTLREVMDLMEKQHGLRATFVSQILQ